MELPFLQEVYWNNTLQKWLTAFVLIALSAIAGKVIGWLFKKVHAVANRTKFRIDGILIDMIDEPVVYIVIVIGFRVSMETLKLPDALRDWIGKGVHVVVALLAGWMLVRLVDALIETYIKPYVENTDNDLDDQLLPVARKGVKLVVWALAFVIGMNNAGYDVGALIAGLGIGGLAFALAAKDSLSNLFGGFTIYADRPFRLNDRIKVAGIDGTVKEIGLRSTRIVTLDGRQVTMPNSTFTDKPVENVSSEPSRRVTLVLGLTYDCGHAGIEKGMATLKSIAADAAGIEEEVKVAFTAFAASALEITFIYNIKKDADIFQTQTAINLAILKRFADEKLDFAFPTQTIYTVSG